MRVWTPWVLAAILGAALSGCAANWKVQARERAVFEEQQSLSLLLERGRFELQCVDAQLHVFERYRGDGPATLAGISGCGRRAMYQRRLRYSHRSGGRTTDNTKWEPASRRGETPILPAAAGPTMQPEQQQGTDAAPPSRVFGAPTQRTGI